MKSLIKLVILLFVAVLMAVYLKQSNGYVSIVTGDERRTMSLLAAVILLVLAFAVLYFLIRLYKGITNTPDNFRSWRHKRRVHKELDLFEQGWVVWLEGRHALAEKDLKKLQSTSNSKSRQTVAMLAQAKMAHVNGNTEDRDKLVDDAIAQSLETPQLYDAGLTVKAEMLVEDGRGREALPLLEKLNADNPNQLNILKLKLRAHKQAGQLREVIKLARYLLKKKKMDKLEAEQLIEQSAAQIIADPEDQLWESLFLSLKSQEQTAAPVALAAAQRYHHKQDYAQESKILEAALKEHKDPRLLTAYAEHCPESQTKHRLEKAQKWLSIERNNPQLLNAAAYLCMLSKLWGQAQSYLEKSLALEPSSHTHALLGALYDKIGEEKKAQLHWRQSSGQVFNVPDMQLPLPAEPDDLKDFPGGAESMQTPVKTVKPKGNSSTVVYQDADDEYFDSAPIPGLEIEDNQTSKQKEDK
ncbi:heme biosynthesis protein HemY [Brackiella oedipodis]|uniref:heme biosynthesis protein HemY n=1 Tax=Brackiella oedipodis TaxID=124225 RepID=UPI00048BA59D|nr:heme biosynthesis HemY N-terminal domain-containing protein [Brackiella oedipodis]